MERASYVIGQENKNVLVKHGGELIRVHPASLLHVHTANPVSFGEIEQSSQQTQQKKENESQQKEENGSQQKEKNKSIDEVDMSDDDSETPDDNKTPENDANQIQISNKVERINHNKNDAPTATNKTKSLHLPPVKSRIAYKLTDSDELQEGFVHSRAGKATGKYRYHLNIQPPKNNKIEEYDFSSDIVEWYPITEEVMIVNNKDLDSITAAKEKELKNWRDNAVYCEVENEGQNTVSCRRVIETKKIDGLDVTKARLVAQGFEDDEAKGRRKDSPTCSKESLRITLALIAASKWNCKSMDIRRAFLQGNSLEREIFTKPPKEADSQGICRLNKCVYGLNEASRY